MSIIGLVDTNDGTDKNLEEILGLFSVATSAVPATFEPTVTRGAIAVVPDTLPSSPTIGTLAIDSADDNMLKWWDGDEWRSASVNISGGGDGGGGSGIGVGQTFNLQQGLEDEIIIAVSGVLVNMSVTNGPLPDGLVLTSNGHLIGTPTVFGTYYVDLEATFDDATVGTGTVELVIAEALLVTFTFDANSISNIAEGEYFEFDLTYTPYPPPLPITWEATGLPNGVTLYSYQNGQTTLYGDPQNTGTYEVTISATNWAGTTSQTFNITVFAYNMEVYGTPGNTMDGLYEPTDTGYYAFNYFGNTPEFMYGQPSLLYSPVRVYTHISESNFKIFFYDTYGSWIIADISSFGASPPLNISPVYGKSTTTLPPQSEWFSSGSISISWTQP